MPKLDAKKLFKNLYTAPTRAPVLVEVPPLTYFMADGQSDPNTSADFQATVEALYALSYTLKFNLKKSDPEQGYSVMPLEGLWWADDPADFAHLNRNKWFWTLMIMQPPRVSAEQFADLVAQVSKKKDLPALPRVRMEILEEGQAAQIRHVGPFSEEGPTIQRLHEFIAAHGCVLFGKHHEIYLSDPRRVPPEKCKTIIRQPCRPRP